MEEVVRDAHHTDEVGTSSESHESSVPKAEAPERTISQPMDFYAMDTPPMAGLMPSRLIGTALNPKSHTIQPLARRIQF